MIARLGDVLYWAGCGAGALVGLVGFVALIASSGPDHLLLGGIFLAIAIGAWLAGRACRYVLAGQ